MKSFSPLIFALLLLAAPALAQENDEIKSREAHDTILIDGQIFTQLIRAKTDEYGEARLPYFYPIVGPTGAKMTRNFPMVDGVAGESKDHPHHTSLWFAHGNVNGVDFWHDKKAKIVSSFTQHSLKSSGPLLSGTRIDTWYAPDGHAVQTNETGFAAGKLDDDTRVLDVWHKLAPAEGVEQVTFGDTKEGTMAIRVAPQLRLKGDVATGQCINSEGDKDAKVWGKRAKWVAYWGVIDGKTCGVAVFDHPTNLRHPTWWHARDYGLVAANPFGMSDFEKGKHKRGAGDYTLKQGETLSLRYRFVFFAGTAEEADIAGKYDAWVKETSHESE